MHRGKRFLLKQTLTVSGLAAVLQAAMLYSRWGLEVEWKFGLHLIRLRFQNQVFAWTLDLESWEVLRLILTLRLGSFFLASATPSNPASMNGIWKLVGINESSLGKPRLLTPAGALSVHHKQRPGGCGRFTKILTAVRNVLHIEIATPPPPPKKRCLHAVRGAFDDDMNAATQYVLSSRYLMVFSQTARLTFERIGFVTPANK